MSLSLKTPAPMARSISATEGFFCSGCEDEVGILAFRVLRIEPAGEEESSLLLLLLLLSGREQRTGDFATGKVMGTLIQLMLLNIFIFFLLQKDKQLMLLH